MTASQANSRRLAVAVWQGVREPLSQSLEQFVDFVDASTYLRQVSRRPGIVRFGSLMTGSGQAMRKLLQFGTLGL